jgi:hypothetical protein
LRLTFRRLKRYPPTRLPQIRRLRRSARERIWGIAGPQRREIDRTMNKPSGETPFDLNAREKSVFQ